MPVTQREITIYAKRQAAINKSQARNKLLAEEFRKQLESGQALPDDGPHVIELAPNGGKELDWKSEFRALLIEKYAKRHAMRMAVLMAERDITEKETLAPPKQEVEILGKKYVGGYKLMVRANPTYRTVRKIA